MKIVWSLAVSALILAVSGACNRKTPESSQPAMRDRGCLVATAADHRNDGEIAKLQQDLREHPAPPKRPSFSAIASSRKRACRTMPASTRWPSRRPRVSSRWRPDEPAALLLRGHVLHQMHRFAEAEAIARRLVTPREFVLDFGLLGDVLMEQGRVDRSGRRLSEDDRPQAVLPVLHAGGAPAMAQRRSRRRDRDDARRGQGGEPARSRVGGLGLLPAGDVRAAARPSRRRGANGGRVAAVRARLRRGAAGARAHPTRPEKERTTRS